MKFLSLKQTILEVLEERAKKDKPITKLLEDMELKEKLKEDKNDLNKTKL